MYIMEIEALETHWIFLKDSFYSINWVVLKY